MLKALQSMIQRLYPLPTKSKQQFRFQMVKPTLSRVSPDTEPSMSDCHTTKLSNNGDYWFVWSGGKELHIFDVEDKIYCCTLIMQSPKNTGEISWFSMFCIISNQIRYADIEWINTKL